MPWHLLLDLIELKFSVRSEMSNMTNSIKTYVYDR
jgi:hypothetical protein